MELAFLACTWNILHPAFAVKWQEPQGVAAVADESELVVEDSCTADAAQAQVQRRESNWPLRAPAIARALLSGTMDFFFLQELGAAELEYLKWYKVDGNCVGDTFDVVYYAHPGRSDGVGVLVRNDRWEVVRRHKLPFKLKAKGNEASLSSSSDATQPPSEHMCSALAWVQPKQHGGAESDRPTLLLASTHFYTKKSEEPQETLLSFLDAQRRHGGADVVLWGGDANQFYYEREAGEAQGGAYPVPSPAGYVCHADRATPTEPAKGKKVDWLFVGVRESGSGTTGTDDDIGRVGSSVQVQVQLESPSEESSGMLQAFREATAAVVPETGHPPSDHAADGVRVVVSGL
jgi:hypothetical protein